MRYVTYAMTAFGLLALALCAQQHLWSYGVHGDIALVGCVIPTALGALAIAAGKLPRWASIVSALAFTIVAMKTTHAPLDNIMMAAAGGLVLAIVLAIRPPRAR